jgi:hypothetical protein
VIGQNGAKVRSKVKLQTSCGKKARRHRRHSRRGRSSRARYPRKGLKHAAARLR